MTAVIVDETLRLEVRLPKSHTAIEVISGSAPSDDCAKLSSARSIQDEKKGLDERETRRRNTAARECLGHPYRATEEKNQSPATNGQNIKETQKMASQGCMLYTRA